MNDLRHHIRCQGIGPLPSIDDWVNMMLFDVAERVASYNAAWDDWERENGTLANGTAHDASVSEDLALDPFEATDASEWMNDGYWEEEAP